MTVVGVVGDIRHLGPATPPRPEIYQPFTQSSFSFMAFVVRTAGDPRAAVTAIRAGIARLDPSQPISTVSTMDEHVARSLSRPRFMSTLTSIFGGLALILSIVGIYGVMAYSVSQRSREIAIRMALGAGRRDVLRLVLSKALWLAVAGVSSGLAAAAVLTRVLSGQLFGVQAGDPLTYVAVVLGLVGVALLAGAVPAVRAMRIDEATVLRS
jgi:putative ABC transport system permease protein